MKSFLPVLAASATVHGAALVYLYQGASVSHVMEVAVPQPAGPMSMRIVSLPSTPWAVEPPIAVEEKAARHPEGYAAAMPAMEAAAVLTEAPAAEDSAARPAPNLPEREEPAEAGEATPMEVAHTSAAVSAELPAPPPPDAASTTGEPSPPSFAWLEAGIRDVLDQAVASYEYPWRCIEDGCHGRVRLGIAVDRWGRVAAVRVVASDTHCPHLDRSCAEQTGDILADTWFLNRGAAPAEDVVVPYDVVWRLTE